MRPILLAAVVVGFLLSLPGPSAGQGGCTWNGDAVYIDVNNDNRVSPGDVRITPARNQPPGHRVQGADADFGAGLANLPGAFRYFDVNGDGQLNGGRSNPDLPFWDTNNNGAGIADIYLSDVKTQWPQVGEIVLPYGHVRSPYDPVPGYNNLPWPVLPTFDFVDDDQDGNVDLNEGVYAIQDSTPPLRIQSKDVRISVEVFNPDYADGTLVLATDPESGAQTAGGNLQIRFADLDSSGGFNYPSGDAWTGCSEPYQKNSASGGGGQTTPPSGGGQTTAPVGAGQTTQAAGGGASSAASGGGGGGGGLDWKVVAIVAVAIVAVAYVLGQRGKKPGP